MITINVMKDSICGSVNNKQFGVPFTPELLKQMEDLQAKSEKVTTIEDYSAIVEEFEKLTVTDYKTTVESEYKNIHVNAATGKHYLKVGNEISSIAMPQALVDRIKESVDKKIDFTPLIKMWTRWLRNPILRKKEKSNLFDNFSTRMFNYVNATYLNAEARNELMIKEGLSLEVANERSTTYQVGITTEGLLRTYKVSREVNHKFELDSDNKAKKVDRKEVAGIDPDTGLITYKEASNEDRLFEPAVMSNGGDAFFCGNKEGHFIRVGEVHRLSDWSKVNTNDSSSCVKGLHCGGLDYIRNYQTQGTETHNILVDPMNIGAVPDDNTGAIRVLEYFVLDAFSGVNGSIYHSSTYAAQSDKKWDEDRKAILEEYGTYKENIETSTKEIEAL